MTASVSRIVEAKALAVLRLFKKTFQQGRSERKPEAYSVGYVEGLRDARTMLEGFFNSRQSASGSALPC